MDSHHELSDQEFEQLFTEGLLDPKLFDHEAHIRLAWIHVSQYGVEKAIENVCDQLVRYVHLIGAGSKYHHTLTVAAIRTVAHFMRRSPFSTFDAFISQHSSLKFYFKELLTSHYSMEILNSDTAKRQYVEPDLQPFEQKDIV